jgi:PAS domain S-box-containing protein
MSSDLIETEAQLDLRLRALQRLTGKKIERSARWSAAAALQVLHDLASAPSTSAAALALVHELQVHQVELDLQEEELRRSRAEVEASLIRQTQLYDFAPVGCFTVDRSTVLQELNLTAACMLGFERDQLLGRALESFLAPPSAHALHAMLADLSTGATVRADTLHLSGRRGAPRRVYASANRDPNTDYFLIAFVDVVGRESESSG